MKSTAALATLFLSLLAPCVAARAQQPAPSPAATPAPAQSPSPTPAATPTPVPSPPARKANERPVVRGVSTPAEPFDGASVEKMAAQCVTLETEAGDIRLEF